MLPVLVRGSLLVGLVYVGAFLFIAALAVGTAWSIWHGRRVFDKAMRTGDLSKLDPGTRALLDQTIQVRPDFAEGLEQRRVAHQRDEAAGPGPS